MISVKVWTAEELGKVNDELEGSPPQDVLRWVVDNFAREDFALACSFGEPVLVDMLVKIKPDARIFSLDTGLHFAETLELKDEIERKYGIRIEMYRPKLTLDEMEREYGPELWKRNPDECCRIRKVEPLKEVLSGLKAWITGIRRDQSPTRKNAPVVGIDPKHGLVKVNPLVNWTSRDVWEYLERNGVPYNRLLDQAFASVGCEPCTRPIIPGEDERAGRWDGFAKTECGLHK
ncbi:MAG: phosphoadenylyl-sulfate reductase [Thermodesulfobacteriota bacterium]